MLAYDKDLDSLKVDQTITVSSELHVAKYQRVGKISALVVELDKCRLNK